MSRQHDSPRSAFDDEALLAGELQHIFDFFPGQTPELVGAELRRRMTQRWEFGSRWASAINIIVPNVEHALTRIYTPDTVMLWYSTFRRNQDEVNQAVAIATSGFVGHLKAVEDYTASVEQDFQTHATQANNQATGLSGQLSKLSGATSALQKQHDGLQSTLEDVVSRVIAMEARLPDIQRLSQRVTAIAAQANASSAVGLRNLRGAPGRSEEPNLVRHFAPAGGPKLLMKPRQHERRHSALSNNQRDSSTAPTLAEELSRNISRDGEDSTDSYPDSDSSTTDPQNSPYLSDTSSLDLRLESLSLGPSATSHIKAEGDADLPLGRLPLCGITLSLPELEVTDGAPATLGEIAASNLEAEPDAEVPIRPYSRETTRSLGGSSPLCGALVTPGANALSHVEAEADADLSLGRLALDEFTRSLPEIEPTDCAPATLGEIAASNLEAERDAKVSHAGDTSARERKGRYLGLRKKFGKRSVLTMSSALVREITAISGHLATLASISLFHLLLADVESGELEFSAIGYIKAESTSPQTRHQILLSALNRTRLLSD
ncbi:hypothetical protein BV25DRAFT_1921718 [Artomyces pyxidatus]|uniref:Uncharacterized protein n=1 Tax=Artomyces pyxidatus TaxID=48021 RepID=A0ACB8SGJ8_9AGAM|nr:hypothetical protein BV25DRAFT_1921718 [Artomyces pyxidatus]